MNIGLGRAWHCLVGVMLLSAGNGSALAAVTLRGETSRPHDSTFCVGETALLHWSVSGLKPGQQEQLTVRIKDEQGTEQTVFTLPLVADDHGNWNGQSSGPANLTGFYRVFATLQDGTVLSPRFTRPAGFLTYAVVPDWKLRPDFGQAASRFGLQGSLGPQSGQVMRRLGVRWLLDGRSWYWREAKEAGQFKAQRVEEIERKKAAAPVPAGEEWRSYRLYGVDGVPHWAGKPETRAAGSRNAELTPEGEKAYAAYCRETATEVVRIHPDEPRRYYQPLWEPL